MKAILSATVTSLVAISIQVITSPAAAAGCGMTASTLDGVRQDKTNPQPIEFKQTYTSGFEEYLEVCFSNSPTAQEIARQVEVTFAKGDAKKAEGILKTVVSVTGNSNSKTAAVDRQVVEILDADKEKFPGTGPLYSRMYNSLPKSRRSEIDGAAATQITRLKPFEAKHFDISEFKAPQAYLERSKINADMLIEPDHLYGERLRKAVEDGSFKMKATR